MAIKPSPSVAYFGSWLLLQKTSTGRANVSQHGAPIRTVRLRGAPGGNSLAPGRHQFSIIESLAGDKALVMFTDRLFSGGGLKGAAVPQGGGTGSCPGGTRRTQGLNGRQKDWRGWWIRARTNRDRRAARGNRNQREPHGLVGTNEGPAIWDEC